jgi:macrolide transport system ATP-binding/permease protein
MSSLIDVKDLTFIYPNSDQVILKNLSLTIQPGEFVSVQGVSGSGKSTLLYLLAGFLHPTKGRVLFDGEDFAGLDDLETASLRNHRMGFIFQQFHLLARKSVLENVLLPESYPIETEPAPIDVSRARDLCEQVGIGAKVDVPPNKLSGGQQQRVAIARALLKRPQILFADEPTGNLDSKTGLEIFTALKKLSEEGIAVVLITHDKSLAAKTDRRIEMRDGEIVSDEGSPKGDSRHFATPGVRSDQTKATLTSQFKRLVSIAWGELQRNRSRSILTLLGILFGVAAVSSMVSLGDYTKRNLLRSYQDMGVNTFGISGQMDWMNGFKGKTSVYQGFQIKNDIQPLTKVFPEIILWSPQLGNNLVQPIFGGRYLESATVFGVNEQMLRITRKELALGRNFHPLQIDQARSVCIIGSEIQKQLFKQMNPINQWMMVKNDDRYFSCQVIGVLKSSSRATGDDLDNKQILVPFGFYAIQATTWYDATLTHVLFEARPGTNMERLSKAVVNFFKVKYGSTGYFYDSTNAVMISQMRKFLTLFTMLLLFVSTLALVVGCIGVSNMMTVSVTERISEFGLRKAVGATNRSLRLQILCESTILCFFAGLAGVAMGFVFQQSAIYSASKLFPKLPYTWEFNFGAVLLALFATFLSGYLSGLSAAKKVEMLSVAEVLRSE